MVKLNAHLGGAVNYVKSLPCSDQSSVGTKGLKKGRMASDVGVWILVGRCLIAADRKHGCKDPVESDRRPATGLVLNIRIGKTVHFCFFLFMLIEYINMYIKWSIQRHCPYWNTYNVDHCGATRSWECQWGFKVIVYSGFFINITSCPLFNESQVSNLQILIQIILQLYINRRVSR